jgi:hypothetical protein
MPTIKQSGGEELRVRIQDFDNEVRGCSNYADIETIQNRIQERRSEGW